MTVYLVDTDVISEARKGDRANAGVRTFFRSASRDATPLFLSAITVGELRQGTEIIRHRGDKPHPENPLDKQIAATALIYDLTVVTRNTSHYEPTGVRVVNPFT